MNSQIFIKGDAATPRHSHSACVWNNHVVLTGGLDANLQALSIVQTMETDVRSILYSYLDWLNTPITWYKTGEKLTVILNSLLTALNGLRRF